MAFRAAPKSGTSEQPSTSKVREMVEEEKRDDAAHAKEPRGKLSSDNTDTDSDDKSFTNALDQEGKQVAVAAPRQVKKNSMDMGAREAAETEGSERKYDLPAALGLVRRVPPPIQVERKPKQVSLERIKARIARVTGMNPYIAGNLGDSPPSLSSPSASSDSSDSESSPITEDDGENGNGNEMESLANFFMANPRHFRRSSSKVKIFKRVYY
ncbi:unnamed protein product [Orchesella dallaii]|uniref:Uncharacterized protein n=1 Tax=Orchesella dallaii TaxID=48710 RepID=A0ABP1R9P9_9HEXA